VKSADEWLKYYQDKNPELDEVMRRVKLAVRNTKKAVYPYQAAALYHLAKPYNGGHALEIGTAYGYSCFYLASAMPDSRITTLNASVGEIESVKATGTLSRFPKVENLHYISWEYLKESDGTAIYNFIFVDGDHKRVRNDLPYFNRLIDGGLMVFHDYSPLGSGRECPPVYEAVNELADRLGRTPEVLIVDNKLVGLAGFIRRSGETI
jgi:predicted O-methyltransferase YrrM